MFREPEQVKNERGDGRTGASIPEVVMILQRSGLVRDGLPAGLFSDAAEGPLRVLARSGQIEEGKSVRAVAEALSIEYVDLDDPATWASLTPAQFAGSVDSSMLWKHRMLPLRFEEGAAVVACADPFDHEGLRLVEFMLGQPIRRAIAEETKILRSIDEFFPSTGEAYDLLPAGTPAPRVEITSGGAVAEETDVGAVSAPPIVRLVNRVIGNAVLERASDIHFEPSDHSLQIRARVDGLLHPVAELPRRLTQKVLSRVKLLSGMDLAEHRRPQDGRMALRIDGGRVDVRVSAVPTPAGEKIVLRILKADPTTFRFDSLGMPQDVRGEVERLLRSTATMLLVTGPTGSGKTTTLYTGLNYVRDGTRNIETVEDPIEYRIPGVAQMEMNSTIGLTFASALRSILRQDPDVIMVGEIRDEETARVAIQAASTGHLVLSTLHTNDAPSAVIRLLDLGVEAYAIAATLGGVVAQRLVRKLCSRCAMLAPTDYLARHEPLIQQLRIERAGMRIPVGCGDCRFTDYRGRTGVYSFLRLTPAIRELVHLHAALDAIVAEARRSAGFRSLEEEGGRLAAAGETTLEELRPLLSAELSQVA